MTEPNQIQNILNFVNNGLMLKLTPGNPQDVKLAARAVQDALSQIPDHILSDFIKEPNIRLRIQKLKPKPSNENPSAKPSKKRHR